jgi:iron(III) transport system substrate-binding protein
VQAQEITAPDTADLTPDKVTEYSQEWARRFQS